MSTVDKIYLSTVLINYIKYINCTNDKLCDIIDSVKK